MSFVDSILFYAHVTPEKPAVIMADRIVTYRMMAAGIRSVESVLRDLHLAAGQIVAVKIDSPARHIIVTSALYRLGIVTMSVTSHMRPGELGFELQAMITDGGPVSWTGATHVADDDWFAHEPLPGASASTRFPQPDALCRITLSSGTTAAPKVVGYSAQTMEDRIVAGRRAMAIAPWDRALILPPLASEYGFGKALQVLGYGHTCVFAFSALETLQLINLYAVDLLLAIPKHLKDLVEVHRTNPIPIHSLKLIQAGADALAPALIPEIRTRFCKTILSMFGTTETGPIAYAPIDRLLDVPGATGYLAPGVELEVIGENGEILPVECEGILRVRTKEQSYDLLNAPAAGAKPPWIYSGDYGKVLPDGMVVLSGRLSDMIKLPGKLTSPGPVEQALASYPGVEEVAALGRPGTSGQHEFWIAIKASGPIDKEGVKEFLSRQNPDWIVTGVMLVDAMPRNDIGKLLRQNLREQIPAR